MELELPEPVGRPRRAEYTPNDFLSFREQGSLEISPKFQRRGVWQLPQRSSFIDTLIRGLPVPPIFLRETQSEDFKRRVREVIDGQQRLRAVLEFVDDAYAISRTLPAAWAGMRMSDLSVAAQNRIRNYHFACEVFDDISDSAVLDIFARMNANSVQLSRQELRNGKFFGHFKALAYSLAFAHLEFWRTNRIFTEQSIARMLEAELTSELMILLMDGVQDKKTSIDRFYADYDESFEQARVVDRHFRHVIDAISDHLEGVLSSTNFRRVPIFYSLFAAVAHRLFGIGKLDLKTARKPLSRREGANLREAVERLSVQVDAGRANEAVPRKYQPFVSACLSQTDNVGPRLRRIAAIYRESGLG
jgi:hypothetical protein